MDEFSFGFALLLLSTGFIAGIINTFAGGGSNLTVPALMVMGMPADIANATNRVGVLLQCMTAAKGFQSHGKLDMPDLKNVVLLTVVGGIIGALAASFLPNALLKPTLLIAMIGMALVMLLKPDWVAPAEGTPPLSIGSNKRAIPMLIFSGIYGGFVQAGVGFILILAIAGSLRYDLVRTNALKVLCTFAFTSFAVAIFVWRGQILWVPGLVLAAGTMAGAFVSVRLAINASQRTMKWFLLIMTICACGAAFMA